MPENTGFEVNSTPENERINPENSHQKRETPHAGTPNTPPFCFLNILKPRGMTSFDVIHTLRKRFNIKKIGHSGTLDPLADGVLQVAVGSATRLIEHLGSNKRYIARIKFGFTSETGDLEGVLTPASAPNFTLDELLHALNSLTGEIEQVPPVYSAIKVGGKKLCDLARRQKALQGAQNDDLNIIKPPKRRVTVFSARLLRVVEFLDTESQTRAEIDGGCPETQPHAGLTPLANPENPQSADGLTHVGQFETVEMATQPAFANSNNVAREKVHGSASGTSSSSGALGKPSSERLFNARLTANHPPSLQSETLAKMPESEQYRTGSRISEIEVEIYCSKGTYIRSFAVDLAERLGTGAFLTGLTRTQAGNFHIENAVAPNEASLAKDGINPIEALDLPVYELTEKEHAGIQNGVAIRAQNPANHCGVARAEVHGSASGTSSSPGAPQKPSPERLFNARLTVNHPSSPDKAPQTLMLVYNGKLVSIGVLEDNIIRAKKVFH